MARVIDITEKLNFGENPNLTIKGVNYEVNSDAMAMLKVMQFMSKDTPGADEITEAYQAMFSEKERKKMEKLRLKFSDFTTVIKEAVTLVVGEGDGSGE